MWRLLGSGGELFVAAVSIGVAVGATNDVSNDEVEASNLSIHLFQFSSTSMLPNAVIKLLYVIKLGTKFDSSNLLTHLAIFLESFVFAKENSVRA